MYMDDMYDIYDEDMFMPVNMLDTMAMPVNPMQQMPMQPPMNPMQQMPMQPPMNPMNPMQQIPMQPPMNPMNPMQQMPMQPPMPPMNPMQPPMQNPMVLYDENPYYPKLALPNAIRLIQRAVGDEKADQLFYEYLIKEAPTREEKDIIASIRDDEMKHNKMFKRIYYDLTGRYLQANEEEQFEKPATYLEGLIRALKGEVGAVARYRQILYALTFRPNINMITEIITDEIRHASLYNYLITLNSTK